MIHLHLTAAGGKPLPSEQQQARLRRIADIALEKSGVLLSVPQYSCLDRFAMDTVVSHTLMLTLTLMRFQGQTDTQPACLGAGWPL